MINYRWQNQVREFHELFGVPTPRGGPKVPTPDRMALRFRIHREEYEEIQQALIDEDLVELADGIVDLIYALLGTAIECDIDIGPIFEEVQRTNMLKEGGKIRGDGKILKPEGWQPPQIKKLLQKQGWEG